MTDEDDCQEHRWSACATCAAGCWICWDCGAESHDGEDDE
jgi:hypothetical protein